MSSIEYSDLAPGMEVTIRWSGCGGVVNTTTGTVHRVTADVVSFGGGSVLRHRSDISRIDLISADAVDAAATR